MRKRRVWLAVGIVVVVCAAILIGAIPRWTARDRVRAETAAAAIPVVAVGRLERAAPTRELVLPGNVQAFASAPIFARTSGYVRRWNTDIGAQVKKGQLLAEIEIPEVHQQLQQARATLAASEATSRLSEATAKRFTSLRQSRAVSQLEVDNAVGALDANRSIVRANQAAVSQLEHLQSYAQIRAPFDGVITARTVDVGDLINAGSSTTPAAALFQIAQPDKLRVYVSVPETQAAEIKVGMPATLKLAGSAERVAGTLVHTASAIDPATRTLLVQISVENAANALFAGAYAEVHMTLSASSPVFMVPVEALLFRKEGLQLATVSGGRVVLKSVVPGRDFGERLEIAQGLRGDEVFILDPPDSILDGAQVRIAHDTAQRTSSARR